MEGCTVEKTLRFSSSFSQMVICLQTWWRPISVCNGEPRAESAYIFSSLTVPTINYSSSYFPLTVATTSLTLYYCQPIQTPIIAHSRNLMGVRDYAAMALTEV